MVFGAFSEISEEARKLLCYATDTTSPCSRTAFTVAGASRRREYARIKIDGLVVRQPGLHQRARARRRRRALLQPAASLRTRSRHPSQAARRGPKTRIDYSFACCKPTVSLCMRQSVSESGRHSSYQLTARSRRVAYSPGRGARRRERLYPRTHRAETSAASVSTQRHGRLLSERC
jgi:hypothetical protein